MDLKQEELSFPSMAQRLKWLMLILSSIWEDKPSHPPSSCSDTHLHHVTSHLAPRWLPGLAQRPITAQCSDAVWDSSNQPDGGERGHTDEGEGSRLFSEGFLGHVVSPPVNKTKRGSEADF